jgi:hypothetical protein
VTAPILRAIGVDGETYDDPSEDLLFMLFDDLERPGASFTIERVEAGRQGESVRVIRERDGSFSLGGGLSLRTTMREAHEALTRWAFDLPSSG